MLGRELRLRWVEDGAGWSGSAQGLKGLMALGDRVGVGIGLLGLWWNECGLSKANPRSDAVLTAEFFGGVGAHPSEDGGGQDGGGIREDLGENVVFGTKGSSGGTHESDSPGREQDLGHQKVAVHLFSSVASCQGLGLSEGDRLLSLKLHKRSLGLPQNVQLFGGSAAIVSAPSSVKTSLAPSPIASSLAL